MPVHGANLFTYYQQVRYELSSVIEGGADSKWTAPLVIAGLNEAQRKIQRELKVATRETSTTLTSGDETYSLPAALQGTGVTRIYVKNEAGTSSYALAQLSYERMRQLYASEDTTTGAPLYWCITPDSRAIEIRPIPSYGIASGIRFFYGFGPAPLARIYKPSITLSLTNALTTGTFSSSIDTVKIQAGDQIGAVETTQFDASSIPTLNHVPMVWYEVSAASGTSLTLVDAYEGSTASGLGFVSAEVLDIDRLYPGVFGYTVVYLTVANLLRKDDKQAAQYYEGLAMRDIENFSPDDAVADTIHQTYTNYPGFFSPR